jgi:hypothetical protein
MFANLHILINREKSALSRIFFCQNKVKTYERIKIKQDIYV